MYLGIDLGTSGVKTTLIDERGELRASAEAPLEVSRPKILWSEQDPDDWWSATRSAVAALRAAHAGGLRGLRGIGLSGQMHGATLLDASDRPLRPSILWNDGRSVAQCRELERAVPRSREITGNLAMPGFTAPKLAWVRAHEPEVFARVTRVLLPKDYVRLCLTGDHASDRSDASGTLWLNVAQRAWSNEMLEACGLDVHAMPLLYEGTEITGQLRGEVAEAFGCERVPVVAGAGDQAAGAAGVGVIREGQGFLSLGTSGVLFVAADAYRANPERAVHAFCHCLPGSWHQMAVMLSAASCLAWAVRLTGAGSETSLLAEVEASGVRSDRLLFLPYLSGERTPHNDPYASGAFVGLDHDTDRAALGRAVLEGVAFGVLDGQEAIIGGGARIDEVSVIGGGARSRLWGGILASVLNRPLVYRSDAAVGPALGAARLAQIGVESAPPSDVCVAPPEDFVALPEPGAVDRYRALHAQFKSLYADLAPAFTRASRRGD